ncbi:hypothetical protein E2562_019692 [Oryza meyeriana var. granulata]|uniref:Pentacotripeptide-repeat region of PRORP domain-containing protein n=1 Tax=Oryza meyeriana var. granulata TaxID=110450 RepID=A0A6G1C7W1_9ORYZ|nr:hypothetical protein E2562_019692 [Oryza meyeriana var. granulata]
MTSEVIAHFLKFKDSGLHPDKVLYNIAMDAYCKHGNMNEAVRLLNEMNKLISAYCQNGDMDKAHTWFHDLVLRGLSVDVIVYTILMNGYCKVNIADEELSVEVRKENEAPVVESKVKNISDTNSSDFTSWPFKKELSSVPDTVPQEHRSKFHLRL